MSSEMMAWAFWQRPKSAGGKLLLISLSDGHLIYDKNNREASCPVATLCDFCCLPSPDEGDGRSTGELWKMLRELDQQGYIEFDEHASDGDNVVVRFPITAGEIRELIRRQGRPPR